MAGYALLHFSCHSIFGMGIAVERLTAMTADLADRNSQRFSLPVLPAR